MDKLNTDIEYLNEENLIRITTNKCLSTVITKELNQFEVEENNNSFIYNIKAFPYNSFVLACLIIKYPNLFKNGKKVFDILKNIAKDVVKPKTTIHNGTHVGIYVPAIPTYTRLMSTLGANNVKMNFHIIKFSRLYEVYRHLKHFNHLFLPKIEISSDLENLLKNKLVEPENMRNLFSIKLQDLYSIKHGYKINIEGFDKLKYNNSVDLLLKRPVRYIDRSDVISFQRIPFGERIFIKGYIHDIYSNFNKKLVIKLSESEDSEPIEITFFGQAYLSRVYKPNDVVYIECVRIKKNMYNGTIILSEEEVKSLPVAPVYRQSPKSRITTRVLTNCVDEMFCRFDGKTISNYIKESKKTLWDNLYDLHFPKDQKSYYNTINDLAYIELVYLQLLFYNKKMTEKKDLGLEKYVEKSYLMEEAIQNLPYSLTNGQSTSINTIIERLNSKFAENILLSGDVGSGKTTVAQAACLYNIDCGYQAVLVGPTEILAQQLYNTFKKFIKPLKNPPTLAYLSGNTKTAEKKEILKGVRNGTIDILVGTHSVFNIEYNNLGLIVIDEQQKFGTEQRERLLHSRKDGIKPDILSQTATPIPRSTALAFYGDIDLIPLTDKPGGRKENITQWIKQPVKEFLRDTLNDTWQHIFKEIKEGHQIFIVTPSVNETAKTASVKAVYKLLEKQFKDIKIDLVHGQMDKNKQNKTIEKFRVGKTQVLVASSIIEVGVDIPNSTIMLVLDADRFGASALHQIRGRVGRSELQGYCYLVSDKETKNAERRLSSLVESADGFQIALVDLETRKEGDLFGNRQSGESNLIFCDLADHTNLIDKAKIEAISIYNSKHKQEALKDAKIFLNRNEGKE